jgi:RimJ/RimL family protein N-acetyltransferase
VAPGIGIRPLLAEDADYLVGVCSLSHCKDFVHVPTVQQVRLAIADQHAASFVIESSGRSVGVIRLGWFGNPVWLVELRLIAIAEPRRGFGTAALRWALHHSFETMRAHRLYLEVAAHNAIARALYERCGFHQEGLWREGFRRADGTYLDLAAYGMLAREYAGNASTGSASNGERRT